ncbi:hypothetical protein CPAV1605_848 [seawater metagenome]|uniref:Uncharacterized protein n=1 Tax=seawater metagenome TaxID=1561972 RepID=A0A5E8CIA5_9ZZZZ
MTELKESKITLNICLNDYPLLKTIKGDELNRFVQRIFDHGYKVLYPEVNESNIYKQQLENMSKQEILESINYLRGDINEMDLQDKLDNLSLVLEKFLGLSQNSNKKGEITEDIIYQLFTAKYKDLAYEKTRDIPHSGDGILTFPNLTSNYLSGNSKLKVLVEIKNYTATVKKDEVDKFKYDMKFNNINFGLFISLKSSIQGHSQLDYEKMIHNNKEYNMVYVSHIDMDTTKIDAALLVLNKLFELENQKSHTDLDWIHAQINAHFQELILVSERTSFLKDNFLTMETNIKSSLNEHYKLLRDYQFNMDKQINSIWERMNKDFGKAKQVLLEKNELDNVLDMYKEDKCYPLMSRIFDILNKSKINLNENSTDKWILKLQENIIGEMKKSKNKVSISLINPCLALAFVRNVDNDQNLKFLDFILKDM